MDFQFQRPMSKPVDSKALKMITCSLQSLEELRLQMKFSTTAHFSNDVSSKVRSALEELRNIKSQVEGIHDNFTPMSINENPLQELRQLTLMHVPSSLTTEVKAKFETLLSEVFVGKIKKIICANLLTCPWYAASQKERGEQAKYNIILVVFLGFDDQFFTPANAHVQTEGNVIDLGWLQAVELAHFGHFIVKGRTRFVEVVLSGQNGILCSSPDWTQLISRLEPKEVMGFRGFVEACRGQAVGGISKKRKTGGLKLKDNTTFFQLCESCRLLQNLECLLDGKSVCTELVNEDLSEAGKQAIGYLKSMYQDSGCNKHEFFPHLVSWKDMVDKELKSFKFSSGAIVESLVGDWMMTTRLQGRQLRMYQVPQDRHASLLQLMDVIGGPVSKMEPANILLIARAGSYMYGLSTPESDVDYMIIYSEPSKVVMSSCRQLSESVENRGPEKKLEYGAYEARLFCEMVLKASVVILELIFADEHDYESPAWKALCEQRTKFVTERGIQQYLGLIKNNFNLVNSQKHIGTGRDRKLFYQIFHKLDSLKYMFGGQCPPVRCSGEVKDFIMRVRTQPQEGDLARENLRQLAKEKYDNLVLQLARRESRLPENTDYRLMLNWLKAVREIS